MRMSGAGRTAPASAPEVQEPAALAFGGIALSLPAGSASWPWPAPYRPFLIRRSDARESDLLRLEVVADGALDTSIRPHARFEPGDGGRQLFGLSRVDDASNRQPPRVIQLGGDSRSS